MIKSKKHVDYGQMELYFTIIMPMQDAPYKPNDNHTDLAQGSFKFWLKALGGYRLAPYKHSLFFDYDSYPCPGIDKLLQLTNPDDSNFGKLWQLPTQEQTILLLALINSLPGKMNCGYLAMK
jgi:hypothetical protein